jgi:hypothetical protein
MKILRALAATLIVVAAAPAAAAPVGFTTPILYALGDCTPSCTPQFQQVYSAAQFSGPILISSIQLEYSVGDASQTYVFSLSTSVNPVGALSTNFSANIGTDAQVFYSGALLAPDAFNKANFIGTSFAYDPANGDLLLDISHPTSESGSLSTYIGGYSPVLQTVARNYSFFASGPGYVFDQNVGMLTVFNADGAVPEPASWAMLIAGFGMVGAVQRRRRTAMAG